MPIIRMLDSSYQQLELFPELQPQRPSIATALDYLFRYHLQFKRCGREMIGNQKALCKTIGHLYFDELTRPQILSLHCAPRSQVVGPQALKHDLKLLTLLYNKLREWSEDKFKSDGIDFSQIKVPPLNPTARIKRPKTYRREIIYVPNEISKILEHATERLKEKIYFAIDTAQSEIDLRSLKVTQYDARRDSLIFTRHKTGKRESIPLSNRCRSIVLKAISDGREYILDWRNHRYEFEDARKKAKVKKQWRDFRKTSINRVHTKAKRLGPAQKIAIHASSRTTQDHYIIDDSEDLRPFVNDLEKTYD